MEMMLLTHCVCLTTAYDFEDASKFLDDFEKKLERRNPGAGSIIEQHLDGTTIAEIGAALRERIPKIVAKTYDPAASAGVIDAQVQDIVTSMERAAGHCTSSSGSGRSRSNGSGSGGSHHSSDSEGNSGRF